MVLMKQVLLPIPRVRSHLQRRLVSMAAVSSAPKEEGNISSVFVSLSGATRPPLPSRFLDLKRSLIAGKEDAVIASWNRLLPVLKSENELIASRGSAVIPSVNFAALSSDLLSKRDDIHKRGCAVVRGVVPREEARGYKREIEEYIRLNKDKTKGFPSHDPQVFELYWSLPQMRARGHPNMLEAQRALMSTWDVKSNDAPISLATPLTYVDRLRIRQPGDSSFALGGHIDGGSVERWERHGYGRGKVYDEIFEGRWDAWNPWVADGRVDAVSDNYNGAGACSMFRMFQGWLSMSDVGPNEGTLMVYPRVNLSMSYILLRPFFRARREYGNGEEERERYLERDNWEFVGDLIDSELQGATPGHAQEVSEATHPHLELSKTVVHVPQIQPGDYVVWHCDSIHAVDKLHAGKGDSSVLYIPVTPLTEQNVVYLSRQREAFRNGWPGPDFPGGKGEQDHSGRPKETDLKGVVSEEGLQAMGLAGLTGSAEETVGQRAIRQRANEILGF